MTDLSVTNMADGVAQIRMRIGGEAQMDAVIKRAAQLTVEDLRFEHPTLEEIFLAYYEGDGEEA